MGSSPLRLDTPPPPPPSVTAQQGAPGGAGQDPMQSFAARMQQAQQGGGAKPDPKGAMVARAQAIGSVLDEMSQMDRNFAPFADRMKQIMTDGLGAALSAGPSGDAREIPGSARPPEAGSGGFSSFPG